MKPVPSDNYIFTRCAEPSTRPQGRALLLAYKFPPHSVGVAHHRPEALYKHLHRFGWDCDVITAEREGTPDDVVQTPDRSWVRSIRQEGSPEAALKSRIGRNLHTGTGTVRREMIRRIKLLMRLSPKWHDEFAGWSYSIEDTIMETARERGSDVIWASCSPYTLAPVAVKCARKLGIPCVIDLRDPLPPYLHFPPGAGHWFYRALSRADAVTAASPCSITRELLEVRSGHLRSDVVTVPSGSWQDEKVAARKSDRFTLIHAGTLVDGGRSPQPLFEAVSLLADRLPSVREDLRMLFIGGDSQVVRSFPGYGAVSGMVELRGQTPYSEVKELMAHSAVLVIIKLDGEVYSDALPAKMYDYMPYEAPVLSFGMSGGLQGRLLEWSNAGRWLGTPADIASFIEDAYSEWKANGMVRRQRNAEAIEYLGQPRMAGDFAAIFSAVKEGRPLQERTDLPWLDSSGGG